ncbi:DUF1566 domain-containing protein [Clostridium sp.]|uniref:Lcl C-terminal domain-containing protein n=1 Tax=Clostridium sp. TaxID=1506 RepID=UPI003D6C9F4B
MKSDNQDKSVDTAVKKPGAVGGQRIPNPSDIDRYTDNEDQTVTDKNTGLIWQQNTTSGLSLSEATSYIDELNKKDSSTWRLPTMPELAMLCDRSLSSPAVDQKYFPSLSVDKYWTSSTLSSGGRQWYVDMSSGMTTYDEPEINHAIILVRTMDEKN